MSIHSKREFCEIVGIKTKDIHGYKKNGKIFVNDDGTIDDNLPVNNEFILKRQKYMEVHGVKSSLPVMTTSVISNTKKVVKTLPAESNPGYGELLESRSIDLETKKLALRRAKVDLELKEIDREKKLGQLIPLELVKPIISTLSYSIITECKNYIDERDRLISKQYNIPAAEVAENKGILTKGLNKAQEKAVAAALSKIKAIVSEFAETRRVGEHD